MPTFLQSCSYSVITTCQDAETDVCLAQMDDLIISRQLLDHSGSCSHADFGSVGPPSAFSAAAFQISHTDRDGDGSCTVWSTQRSSFLLQEGAEFSGCCWIKNAFVLVFRWNVRREGSCLPKRAWRGRRLSISAPKTGTKLSCWLPVRSWRVCFWQPNRLVIISSTWHSQTLHCTYFHAFVLNR